MHHDDWEQTPHRTSASTVANPTSWARKLKKLLLRHWQPEVLPAPAVDADLPRLTGLERAAEVARFIMAKLEYWLSPLGNLREFIRLNFRLALILAIPVFMVAPLITMALEQLNAWVSLLSKTMSSFILFPLSVILSVLLVSGVLYIGRSLLDLRLRAQRRDPYY